MANAHDLLMAQRAAMMGKSLPYDAEVEWLDSGPDKLAYINTMLNPSIYWSGYIDVEVTSWFYLSGFPIVQTCGNFKSGSGCSPVCVPGPYTSSSDRYSTSRFGNGTILTYPNEVFTHRFNAYFDKDGRLVNGSIFAKWDVIPTSMVFDASGFCVFRANNSQSRGRCKCFSFWLSDESGNKVIDLIPVRFTNSLGVSEGAMYDRVSGQLLRNAGTGAFVIGPDKT